MRALYDSKSKSMNDRGIKYLLTNEAKYQAWLDVEAALAKAQAAFGIIPSGAAKNIGLACKLENLDLEQMEIIQQKIGHGFVPFLKVLVKACDKESGKYIHYGVTTQNIQQTAQLLLMKRIHDKFLEVVGEILQNLAKLAEENKDTILPGRTHGKHAIPITYGYKVSVWISELLASVERMEEVQKRVFNVMMGGAVGAFNSSGKVGRKVQDRVAELLNMYSMDIPSRNISTHKVEYIMNLSLLASTFHKIAEEVYYTSIEEFGEVSEKFQSGTVGSSTMPHKINPKLSKGIIANSQKLYSLVSMGLYSCPRPFEGDSTSYMLFDATLEEALSLTTEILLRGEELTRTLTINKENMYKNVLLNNGLDNSEYVMMEIARKLGKDEAHSLVYQLVMKSYLEGRNYFDVLSENPIIADAFTEEQIREMLDPKNYIGLSTQLAEEFSLKAINASKSIQEKNYSSCLVASNK
ncbi:adenylosuccinate lyase family protein [Bacillus sp. ISL-40]|nr:MULTISPECIES: adenylosuccinate lyase family protein [unclassified Bacillus (in: firmicutes)]MBT2698976.1 adenylosuccinate lyase family protein [Bacillus sp. ISL-40]MBT2721062.1 adenylosuccinate lyase family protein [Bacillus sp. ISL-46]MBT2742624.1 adenylosuccinate lyase family protein [Bacillus sp. ISL-77]